MVNRNTSDSEESMDFMSDDSEANDSEDAVAEESMPCKDVQTSSKRQSTSGNNSKSADVVARQSLEDVSSSVSKVNDSSQIPAKSKLTKHKPSKRRLEGTSPMPVDTETSYEDSDDEMNGDSPNVLRSSKDKDSENSPDDESVCSNSEIATNEESISCNPVNDSTIEIVSRKNPQNSESEFTSSCRISSRKQSKPPTRLAVKRVTRSSLSKSTDPEIEEPACEDSISVPSKDDASKAQQESEIKDSETSKNVGDSESEFTSSSRSSAKNQSKRRTHTAVKRVTRSSLSKSTDPEVDEPTCENSKLIPHEDGASDSQQKPENEDSENGHAEEAMSCKDRQSAANEKLSSDDVANNSDAEITLNRSPEASPIRSSRSSAKMKPKSQKVLKRRSRSSLSEPTDPENEEPTTQRDSENEDVDTISNTQQGSKESDLNSLSCNAVKIKRKTQKADKKTKNSKCKPVDAEDQDNCEVKESVTHKNSTNNSVPDKESDNVSESVLTKNTGKGSSKATTEADKAKTEKQKSKNKKTRNPKRKKKPKKSRNLDFLHELLENEDIPLSAKLILQKDDALEVLSAAEIDTLFQNLSETVKSAAELIFEDLKHEVALKWLKSVSLLTICIVESLEPDEPIEESVSHVASLLGLLQKLDIDLDLKENITEVCTLVLGKNCEFSDQVFFLTINSLIDFILLSPPKSQRFKKCVKLLQSLERVIARLQITSKACEPLVGKFVNIVQCKEILTMKEGKAFISLLLTMDETLLLRFHQAIRVTLALPQTKKPHANGYGEAYYLAWYRSAENKEIRQAIEKKCFQNYMQAIFTMQRSGLEMSSLGHNVFSILSHLHNKREHMRLSTTITNLYTPLLWRYLRFENNLIRCNSAEVFFDVYPLEYHGAARPEKIMHLDRQHQEMADLLIDNCHLVRIIAVRGVFSCLKSSWPTFPPESVQKLMTIILNDCINDGSSSDVRCAVYRGFSNILENADTHEYLTSILPDLGNYLTDECDKARVAFIKLLQKVKNSGLENLKYFHICDVKLLTRRLAAETNESVTKALTELIFTDIFSKDRNEYVTLKRLVKLIQMNPTAGRKLIQHSAKLLPYDQAYRLMMVILATLRNHVLGKVEKMSKAAEAEEDDIPEEIKPKSKKRRTNYRPLSERTNTIDDDSCQDTSKSSSADSTDSNVSASKIDESSASSIKEEKLSPLDDLPVSHGLFDVVSLLWIIHHTTLNSPDNQTDLKDLYELATTQISTLLKYYKGTETFFGLLQLASLIPLSKIMTSYCHIANACISQLRNFGHKLPYQECRCIVNTLCAWNRGNDILDLVYDWLNEAFKAENLNSSAFPANRAEARKKTIRFEAIEVKPTCSLNLLDMIFSNPVDKNRVLTKNYNQLMELFNFLERVKNLIKKRIKNDVEFHEDFLSDEFLRRCLDTYLKLAIVLHKDSEPNASSAPLTKTFSASEFYPEILEWCESTLVARLDPTPDPVICSFISVIVQAGSTMLAINLLDIHVMANILKMLSKCLSYGENGMLVLETAVKFLGLTLNQALNRYSAKNLRHIYVSTIPHFLECILDAAFYRNYDQEIIMECVNDIVGMKKTLREILANYAQVHVNDKTNSILPRLINILAKAVVRSYTIEVLKHNVAVQIVKLNNLPFFTNFLLSLINARPVFCSIFLTCLNRNVSELYLHNGGQLLATISLLFTFSMNKFKFKPAEFNASVKLANDILMKYRSSPDESKLNESSASSGILDREHNLDEQDVQSQGAQLLQKISEKIEENNSNE